MSKKKLMMGGMVLVVVLAFSPVWAANSEKLPLSIEVNAGLDYDSNVTLQSREDDTARFVFGNGDGLYKHQANVGYNLGLTNELGLLCQYSFYQDMHFRLTQYDAMIHNFGLTPTWRLFNGTGQLVSLFNFTYMDIGSDKYKTAYSVLPTYFQMLTDRTMLEFGVRFDRNYYWAPVFVQQDDRSTHTYGASMGVYYYVNDQRTGYLMARFSYENDFAAGDNYDSESYRLRLEAAWPIIKRLRTRVYVDLLRQCFDKPWWDAHNLTRIANLQPPLIFPKRQDHVVETGLNLTYAIYRGLEGQVHMTYTHSASDITWYKYDRFVIGGLIGYRY
ncbi:MAG: hypothetical protein PHW74_11355 [Desulfobacca sp.]|nr:hypothetical protein [Desulfobacca sp.]